MGTGPEDGEPQWGGRLGASPGEEGMLIPGGAGGGGAARVAVSAEAEMRSEEPVGGEEIAPLAGNPIRLVPAKYRDAVARSFEGKNRAENERL